MVHGVAHRSGAGGGAALTREERRALRAIEEALEAEDPRLADLLREPARVRCARQLRRFRWLAGTIVVTLILLGVVLSSSALMLAGLATLVVYPSICWDRASRPRADGR
jgi:DUF3040 family protein